MNGRVFAVNRSPVLAWNVEVPYPDMPAAAAAAISPIVPTASDPYGRCWQNQVDPGSSFPYFGTLYNNSLPPTAYRLQPGCMPNLGQFWPPTPPPDGCGRFDGSNLYFAPGLLRPGENISSNIRNSFQSLGHYSHLVETPKEQNQRVFKHETISPNVSSSSIASGSDNLNACCAVDSQLKSQCSAVRSLSKHQELIPVSSGHESLIYAPEIRSSSSIYPSAEKPGFTSTFALKSNLSIHSPPQENTFKAKAQENNNNASPMKNVYFSHCENVNPLQCKSSDEHFYSNHKHPTMSSKCRSLHQSSGEYHVADQFSKKYEYRIVPDFPKVVPSQRASDNALKEQFKQKTSSSKIKPEKANQSDCKYQKSGSRSSTIVQNPECKSSHFLNIPTSTMMHPKSEPPSDKYLITSCPSTASSCMASSYVTSSSPFMMPSSLSRTSVTNYQPSMYQNSCPLNRSWSYNELPLISPDNYLKTPEAAKPQFQNQAHVTSALHEGSISVAQTAPPDIQAAKEAGNVQGQAHVSPTHQTQASTDDDDVQIIAVQSPTSSKHSGRHSLDKRPDYHQSSSAINPLNFKSEKLEANLHQHSPTSEDQNLKRESPLFNGPDCLFDSSPKQGNRDEKAGLLDAVQAQPQIETESSHVEEEEPVEVATVHEEPEKIERITIFSNQIEIPKEIEEALEKLSNPDGLEKVATIEMEAEEEPIISKSISEDTAVSGDAPSDLDSKTNDLKQQSSADFSENHGLNLLSDTIEKVTLFGTVGPLKTNLTSENFSSSSDVNTSPSPSSNVLKRRGLELLSSIAVERLVSEFDVIKIKPVGAPVNSNYPQPKEGQKQMPEDEDLLRQSGDAVAKSPKSSSVFEMQDRLAELQKRYKQKQKELLKLKPKKRLANTYLKCCHKVPGESSDTVSVSVSNTSSCNTSVCSAVCDIQVQLKVKNTVAELTSDAHSKDDNGEDGKKRPKRSQRLVPFKKDSSIEILTDEEVREICVNKRITRRSVRRNSVKYLASNMERKRLSVSLDSRRIKHNQRNNFSKLGKKRKSPSCTASDDASQKRSSNDNSQIPQSLPENIKSSKSYTLRHSSLTSLKMTGSASTSKAATNFKAISSKRKSDNPKRYVPSKQGKMSETIIAKHLRSRILFDTSGPVSDEENAKDSVPDDLYAALMKCHLVDESGNGEKTNSEDEGSEISCEDPLGFPEPSKLNPKQLTERHRLLALEDGQFFAGYIKECETSDRFCVALDGQRGRVNYFTREELLTQAIVESKPLTTTLPEGTRVCAYWRQQYRCLYPGVIGKAPCPSADWSEPRVFVQFDDGDSGQIPTKHVRLIPLDIILPGTESRLDSSSTSSTNSDLKCKGRGKVPRRLRSSTPKKKHKGIPNENESKESSCTSIIDSSCDDSCFMDYSWSPSQNTETFNSTDNQSPNNIDCCRPEKRQRKHSKRGVTCRRDNECSEAKGEAKSKHHKKYKDKHRRHHHHHRKHRHHHHHHHSKKHRHRRKTGKSPTFQDLDCENCIPCKSNLKSHKDSEVASTDNLIEHSSTILLPQSD